MLINTFFPYSTGEQVAIATQKYQPPVLLNKTEKKFSGSLINRYKKKAPAGKPALLIRFTPNAIILQQSHYLSHQEKKGPAVYLVCLPENILISQSIMLQIYPLHAGYRY